MAFSFTIPSYFTAIDKLSGPVSLMEGRLGTFTKRTEQRFKALEVSAMSFARKSALIGIAFLTPLGLAAKTAVDFEDKMADVAKVANVIIGSSQFDKLGDQAKRLGMFLGIDATEAAGLMQNLSQGGVALADLEKVSTIAGKIGVAFGVSADLAGEAFIKTRNALGGTIESTEKLMDAINFLGNTTAASSANLITFMSSGGSAAAAAAGASGEALSAMGAQLISMGKSAEESATIMERFVKASLMTKSLRSTFERAGGGAQGMMAIIEKGSKLSGKAQDAYFRQFGQYGLSIQLLAKNFGQLEKTVNAATNAELTANSVQQEFENRTKTTAFRLAQAKSNLQTMAITLGSQLLPAINSVLSKLIPFIGRIIEWTKNNKETTKSIIKLTLIIGGVVAAISAGAFVVGIFSKVVLAGTALLKAYSAAVWLWTSAQWALNSAILANPLGVLLALITAVIAVVILAIRYWDEWGASLVLVLGIVGIFFSPIIAGFLAVISIIQSFRRNWDMIVNAFKEKGILGGIIAIGKAIFDVILYPVQQLMGIIGKLTGWNWAENAFKNIEKFRGELGLYTEGSAAQTPVNNKESQANAISGNINGRLENKLTVDFKNMPAGVSVDGDKNNNTVIPFTTSTMDI